ncbi:hypothetical protein Q0590_24890 [Rhodocytophaga aerolata]|uniref:Uncharacterized protein n=1 Tax=Rhodocytophaga aerolata TaxID=455078 RepID=A0ABT8RBP5_9BACT|nr:hypothetical protein [Rhodocytophaga aerolata]MDO1449537.1 hypothetical protein [Rhodocytophaga aerolata]
MDKPKYSPKQITLYRTNEFKTRLALKNYFKEYNLSCSDLKDEIRGQTKDAMFEIYSDYCLKNKVTTDLTYLLPITHSNIGYLCTGKKNRERNSHNIIPRLMKAGLVLSKRKIQHKFTDELINCIELKLNPKFVLFKVEKKDAPMSLSVDNLDFLVDKLVDKFGASGKRQNKAPFKITMTDLIEAHLRYHP